MIQKFVDCKQFDIVHTLKISIGMNDIGQAKKLNAVYDIPHTMKVLCKLTSHWRLQVVSFRRVRIYTTKLQGVGRDGVLGIATRCGLNGLGNRTPVGRVESGTKFSSPIKTGPCGYSNLLYNGYRLSFPGENRPERDDEHLSPCITEIKELVELYLYYNPLLPCRHGLLQGEL